MCLIWSISFLVWERYILPLAEFFLEFFSPLSYYYDNQYLCKNILDQNITYFIHDMHEAWFPGIYFLYGAYITDKFFEAEVWSSKKY